jgi:hypothetical protein
MPISQSQIDALNTATFTFADDVDNWCQTRLKSHYLTWFNANVAGKGPWDKVAVVDTDANKVGFHGFWNNIPILTGSTLKPIQFLALMGIFANECRANFTPQAEKMGRPGFPELTYLFDAIPGVKKSYNTLPDNKTAQACFNNPAFNAAHAAKPLGAQLANTTDARWAGPAYPRATVPFANNPAITGYVMEADFMKFRGRGFIQTTTRTNYVKIIQYIQAYDGDNNVIDFYQARWKGLTPDNAAYASSNEDWDRLFQQTDLIIAAKAIERHNAGSGNYLALTGDPDTAIRNMGKRISGGTDYAAKYRDRMELLITQALS